MNSSREQVDIVDNPWHSVRVGVNRPVPVRGGSLAAGAWETGSAMMTLRSSGETVSPPYRAEDADALRSEPFEL